MAFLTAESKIYGNNLMLYHQNIKTTDGYVHWNSTHHSQRPIFLYVMLHPTIRKKYKKYILSWILIRISININHFFLDSRLYTIPHNFLQVYQ